MAEIELSVLNGQCLDRRIADESDSGRRGRRPEPRAQRG
jgi:hypothetical protein